jgi:hypothetical protein
MRFRLFIVLLLTAGTAAAQEVSTAIVPVVGSVFGATMVRWRTDVEIVNDTGQSVDVAVELPLSPEANVIFFTLAPGEIQRFTDIIGQAFGLDHALSPLRVTTSGRRSVTVRAAAYASRDAEVFPAQPLAVYVGPTFFPSRILDNLAFSDDFRTNIGLVNLGEQDAYVVLALQRIVGRPIAVSHLRVPANSIVHESIQSLFPLISKGEGFTVVIETSARDTLVYASVVESANHSGKFIAPRVGLR